MKLFLKMGFCLLSGIILTPMAMATEVSNSNLLVPVSNVRSILGSTNPNQLNMTVSGNTTVVRFFIRFYQGGTNCSGFDLLDLDATQRSEVLHAGVTYTTNDATWFAICNQGNHCGTVATSNIQSVKFFWLDGSSQQVGSSVCANVTLENHLGGTCTNSDCGFSSSVSTWAVN